MCAGGRVGRSKKKERARGSAKSLDKLEIRHRRLGLDYMKSMTRRVQGEKEWRGVNWTKEGGIALGSKLEWAASSSSSLLFFLPLLFPLFLPLP